TSGQALAWLFREPPSAVDEGDDESDVDHHREQGEPHRGDARAAAPRGNLFGAHRLLRHGDRKLRHQCAVPRVPRATISASGGTSQLWYGAGEGSSHSRPWAPSHTRSVAFAPPFTHCQMAIGNSSCDRPKPNAPIEDTMFHSENCVE